MYNVCIFFACLCLMKNENQQYLYAYFALFGMFVMFLYIDWIHNVLREIASGGRTGSCV